MAKNPIDYLQLGNGYKHYGHFGKNFLTNTLKLSPEEIKMLDNDEMLVKLMENKIMHRLLYYNLTDPMFLYYIWGLHPPVEKYRKIKLPVFATKEFS